MTCITIARPQIMCSGFGPGGAHPRALAGGEDDRGNSHDVYVLSHVPHLGGPVAGLGGAVELRGEDSNPYTRHQKPLSCH